MRWSLLAALAVCLALALLASVTSAQESSDRVLMDLTLRVALGRAGGHCLLLDAGTLEVSVQSVDGRADSPSGPPFFALGPYRTTPAQAGSPPEIEGIQVSAARITAALPVEGGLYCYSFSAGSTPEIDALPARERDAHFRYVAFRMTLASQ